MSPPAADISPSMHPLSSPNAIPPRTSSTHGRSNSNSAAAAAATNTTTTTTTTTAPAVQPNLPPKSALRPLAESDWLSQKQRAWQTPSIIKAAAALNGADGSHHTAATANGLASGVNGMDGLHGMSNLPPTPRSPDPSRYADEDLDFTAKGSWRHEKELVVRGPYDYVISHPGKDFRSQLISAFNAWLDVPPASLEIITNVVGMLHESSLLVDDVQDSSELRRGFPVAHSIFGVAQTINSANYIYFVALQEIQKLQNLQAISVFAEELVYLHRGQGMDLFWRDTLTCPTEEDYLEMVGNKTAGLFRLGIKLMQAESSSGIDCVPLVNLVGLIFQIRDDYMNLSSKEYSDNKGMCEDLTEGKFSFPVIHSIRADPNNLQLINILKQKTSDVQIKRYAVSYMERTGSFAYTRKVLNVLIDRARKTVEEVDQGRGMAKGVHMILDKMVLADP